MGERATEHQNLIDFSCSPDWIEHYAREGMTPDYPLDYYLDPLRKRIREIEEKMDELISDWEARIKELEAKPVIYQEVQPIVTLKDGQF